MRMVFIDRCNIVVDREVLLSIKGEISSTNGVVRLHARVVLLEKCNDRLGRECNELTTNNAILKRIESCTLITGSPSYVENTDNSVVADWHAFIVL